MTQTQVDMGIKEDVYYEGGPHVGDLIINLLLGLTVICLPLTVGAIVRALWLRYRITSRRLSITSGWRGQDCTEIIYSEVAKVVTVPRGLGAWGDMVITLKDGSRLELRAVPNFRDLYNYIGERISDKARTASGSVGSKT
jgi:nitrogen fixation protein